MLYLVFGSLLLLGSIAITCCFYYTQGSKKTNARVIDSTCNVERNEDVISEIVVQHLLQVTTKTGEIEYTTSCLPVREAAGSEIKIQFNRKTGEPECINWNEYLPVTAGMAITGLISLLFYFLQNGCMELLKDIDYHSIFSAFFICVGLLSFHAIFHMINPNVVKVRGNFEGLMYVNEQKANCEIYSLWYGEHQQYARCNHGSIIMGKKDKQTVLYYHVKKGTVRKRADIFCNACFGMALIVIGIAVLFLPI